MGLGHSWLPWACFGLGLAGAAAATWLQFWTSAVSWPINVGGRPWNSLPAFVPVMFEVMVLFAGVGTVLTFFAFRGLYPGRRAAVPDPRATNDRFVLVLEQTGAASPGVLRQVFNRCRATAVEERETEESLS
jgi:hypothetical protein